MAVFSIPNRPRMLHKSPDTINCETVNTLMPPSYYQRFSEILKVYLPRDGQSEVIKLPVEGVWCTSFSKSLEKEKRYWRPCLAIVIQGKKEIWLGERKFLLQQGHYTFSPVALPVISRIMVPSSLEPFLAVLIQYEPEVISVLERQIDSIQPINMEKTSTALFKGLVSEPMLKSLSRICDSFTKDLDAKVLGPLAVREMFFHLMTGENGSVVRQFIRSSTKAHKICQVIHSIQADLAQDVNIASLALFANMSRSKFFEEFRSITSMTPIQYQKKLRLLEARRLMLEEGGTAEGAAYKVGYNSSSQFSREYTRMFAISPAKDKARNRKPDTHTNKC